MLNCSRQSYARAIVTTEVIDGKVFWKPRDDKGWDQAARKPPPATKNGAPVKVFYNHNRDYICRLYYLCMFHLILCFACTTLMVIIDPCEQRKWYKVFITSGCKMPVQSELVRYSGADNLKLLAPERAKRFQEYLQVCCNLHRGKDYKYIKDAFFPLWNFQEKENVCTVYGFNVLHDTLIGYV